MRCYCRCDTNEVTIDRSCLVPARPGHLAVAELLALMVVMRMTMTSGDARCALLLQPGRPAALQTVHTVDRVYLTDTQHGSCRDGATANGGGTAQEQNQGQAAIFFTCCVVLTPV